MTDTLTYGSSSTSSLCVATKQRSRRRKAVAAVDFDFVFSRCLFTFDRQSSQQQLHPLCLQQCNQCSSQVITHHLPSPVIDSPRTRSSTHTAPPSHLHPRTNRSYVPAMQQSSPQQSRPTPQQPGNVTPGPPQPKPQPVLSSDMIQSYLDQNQLFIAAIVENQSMGKLQAAMEYQIKLQQNLLFLASLADQTGGGHTQPSTPSNSSGANR